MSSESERLLEGSVEYSYANHKWRKTRSNQERWWWKVLTAPWYTAEDLCGQEHFYILGEEEEKYEPYRGDESATHDLSITISLRSPLNEMTLPNLRALNDFRTSFEGRGCRGALRRSRPRLLGQPLLTPLNWRKSAPGMYSGEPQNPQSDL